MNTNTETEERCDRQHVMMAELEKITKQLTRMSHSHDHSLESREAVIRAAIACGDARHALVRAP